MRTQIFNSANGDRPDVPNVAILITDGVPTREVDGLHAEVQLDWAANIHIVGIGVTNNVSPREHILLLAQLLAISDYCRFVIYDPLSVAPRFSFPCD
jgi:hypothetical protein